MFAVAACMQLCCAICKKLCSCALLVCIAFDLCRMRACLLAAAWLDRQANMLVEQGTIWVAISCAHVNAPLLPCSLLLGGVCASELFQYCSHACWSGAWLGGTLDCAHLSAPCVSMQGSCHSLQEISLLLGQDSWKPTTQQAAAQQQQCVAPARMLARRSLLCSAVGGVAPSGCGTF